MRLTLNDPHAVPALLAALRRAGCAAVPVPAHAIDVVFPWVRTLADARQAIVELAFFAHAWELAHPGVAVSVDTAPSQARAGA